MNWKPGMLLRLETDRFIIRTLTVDDASEQYQDWTEDPELMGMMNRIPKRMNPEQLMRYFHRFDNRLSFHLGVFCKKKDRLIGFYALQCNPTHKAAKIEVMIGDREYWGKGVVLETRAKILEFFFEEVGVEKIWGTPIGRNFPAIFNYKAQGFRCEGILRKHLVSPDGNRVDQYSFGLLRDEWRAGRSVAE